MYTHTHTHTYPDIPIPMGESLSGSVIDCKQTVLGISIMLVLGGNPYLFLAIVLVLQSNQFFVALFQCNLSESSEIKIFDRNWKNWTNEFYSKSS